MNETCSDSGQDSLLNLSSFEIEKSLKSTKANSLLINDLNKCTYFLEKPNKNLYCPVCYDLYKNPVLIDCSHTICNDCISTDSNNNLIVNRCPIDNNICNIKLLNRNIAEQIDDLLIRCRYGVLVVPNNDNKKSYKFQLSLPFYSLCERLPSDASFLAKSLTITNSYTKNDFKLVLDEDGCKEDVRFGKRKYEF
jgi:hypothetical protein